jgi:hypothetical protein
MTDALLMLFPCVRPLAPNRSRDCSPPDFVDTVQRRACVPPGHLQGESELATRGM